MERLPTEIFHRIFDHLDTQTIVFSIRLVSRLLRSVVSCYDRYKLDCQMISKCNFHGLCRFIQPRQLISLTLYHNDKIPDQISFFISNYRFRQLDRLHSLNLFGIDEFHLNMLLKHIDFKCLSSFSFYIKKYDERRKKITQKDLFSVLSQSTLRKVEFDLKNKRLSDIQWPSNCQIEDLIIDANITTDNLCRILSHSPQLHQLSLKQQILNMPDKINQNYSFSQITSLILENINMEIDKIESCLLLTSSLIYLKLIGDVRTFDGKRWEDFIQVNLPHLNKFEFFIRSWKSTAQTQDDLQLLIQTFQTPFWIEYKKWFVACEFLLQRRYQIQIYSIPTFKTIFDDQLNSEICFLSTSNHLIEIENIEKIHLKLEKTINVNILKAINIPFPNVTKLHLNFDPGFLNDSIKHVYSIFNYSQLIEVHLESECFGSENKHFLFDIIKLIEPAAKLTSLTIRSHYYKSTIYTFLNELCLILPRQIQFLQIPVNQIEQVEIILERCSYLSIGKFETKAAKLSAEIAEWFEDNTINSTVQRQDAFIHIWIGKKINQIYENPKRMKQNDVF